MAKLFACLLITVIALIGCAPLLAHENTSAEKYFYIPDNVSDEMRAIVYLVRDYLDEASFRNLGQRFVENDLFHNRRGGEDLTYWDLRWIQDENPINAWCVFRHYCDERIAEEGVWFSRLWQCYYLDNFVGTHLLNSEEISSTYFRFVDIFNNGTEALVIGTMDGGSMFGGNTEIYKICVWRSVVTHYTTLGANTFTTHRIVNYNGINFLVYPAAWPTLTWDDWYLGFNIALFKDGTPESLFVSKNGVSESLFYFWGFW